MKHSKEVNEMKSLLLYIGMFIVVLVIAISMYGRLSKYKIRVKVTEKYYVKGLDMKILAIIILPVMIAGIRFYVGVDYGSYENMFFLVRAGQALDFEIAYIALNKLIGIFTGNFMAVTIVVAFITYYLAVKSIIQLCGEDKKSIPFVIWFYFLTMFPASLNIMRQTIAVSIVMYGLTFIIKKKYWKYVLCVVCATLFHSSAFICLIFVLFNHNILSIKKFSIFLVTFCGCLLLATNPSILNAVIANTPIINRYITHEMSSNYIFWKNFIVVIPYFVVLLWYRKLENHNKENLVFLNLMLFELILMILAIQYQWAFRMISYTTMAKYILLPQFIKLFHGKKVRIALTAGYMIFGLLMFIYGVYFGNMNGIFPYRTKRGGL